MRGGVPIPYILLARKKKRSGSVLILPSAGINGRKIPVEKEYFTVLTLNAYAGRYLDPLLSLVCCEGLSADTLCFQEIPSSTVQVEFGGGLAKLSRANMTYLAAV